jgi:uncharacterized protein YcfL
MRSLKLFFILSILFLLSACGSNQGVIANEQVSYLYFTGAAEGSAVTVGETNPFVIDKVGKRNLYKVAKGKQHITVKKNNTIVVDRMVLLGDGQSKEIYIPTIK